MAELFADIPQALQNSVEIARRCNLSIELGKSRLPAFPTPGGRVGGRATCSSRGARRACRAHRAAALRAKTPRYRERLEFEIQHHRPDGLRRLLPDRRRLHQLGEGATACRWGPGAARARARWSPTRSASPTSIRCATTCCSSASSTRSACRCPTSTSTSARTGATGSSTTCARKYGADSVSQIATFGTMAARAVVRDVRARARSRLQLLRPAREADPVPAGQADHARGRAQDGAAARRAREERGGGARAARARRASSRAWRATSACTPAAC